MPRLAVDVDPALRFLLPRGRRRSGLEVDAGATDTAGHVVQSLGIPLTEVGELRLGDRLVARAEQRRAPIGSAAVLAVRRRPRPQQHGGRFLLDVHLAALARRLRLLGIDAAHQPDPEDARLADWAAREQRVLLTRDVALLFRAVVPDGALLVHDDVGDQLDDMLDRFAPVLAPWTRCLVCGRPLAPVAAEDVAGEIEPGTLRTYRDFSRCTGCGRVYWRGAHSRRLEEIVEHARERVGPSDAVQGTPAAVPEAAASRDADVRTGRGGERPPR